MVLVRAARGQPAERDLGAEHPDAPLGRSGDSRDRALGTEDRSGHACHGARLPRVESRAARRLVSEMILLGLPLGGHGRRDAGALLGSSSALEQWPSFGGGVRRGGGDVSEWRLGRRQVEARHTRAFGHVAHIERERRDGAVPDGFRRRTSRAGTRVVPLLRLGWL